jgi:hypothetical protein
MVEEPLVDMAYLLDVQLAEGQAARFGLPSSGNAHLQYLQ